MLSYLAIGNFHLNQQSSSQRCLYSLSTVGALNLLFDNFDSSIFLCMLLYNYLRCRLVIGFFCLLFRCRLFCLFFCYRLFCAYTNLTRQVASTRPRPAANCL